MNGLIFLLFFCSGVSGLIYQVVWIREFGNVFGNTVYSASLVIAVFMLGLGAGSYAIGRWADRRYAARPESLLRAYGLFEAGIAGLGLVISLILPHLDVISAALSFYSTNATGWHVVSTVSYLAQGLIAAVLLVPITLLMGGTLTLLIRHLVRKQVRVAGNRIALLYGINTAGAALGAFLTDFSLVPSLGLRGTQMVAVALNLLVAVAALLMPPQKAPQAEPDLSAPSPEVASRKGKPRKRTELQPPATVVAPASVQRLTALALALSGFGALGMELVWFRHFTLLLGGFRGVFSLLLSVILVGIGVGSLLGASLLRRWNRRPAAMLMVVQGILVAATLLGLTTTSSSGVLAGADAVAPAGAAVATGTELWLNLVTMVTELGLPVLLMGVAFPLANAIIQDAEPEVGQRAGLLYLSNTIGAVAGSLAAGFVFLPVLGIQQSATAVALASALAIVPLFLATRVAAHERAGSLGQIGALAGSALLALIAMLSWLSLPPNYLIANAQIPPVEGEKIVALDEGVNEVITIADVPDAGRQLLTNGHPMSSTNRMSQRYMRALAHIPLLLLDRPAERTLVVGFGVGETVHAMTLHPETKVDLADLSTGVLGHATYFAETNKDVLESPRVTVYVNDGRQHLRMQPEAVYDVIALEPPPITHAGIGSLYSKDFYALARTRLKPRGYLSQWLPAYQVAPDVALAMVRAFVDVFPNAVLLSGADAELLLVGTNDQSMTIDPVKVNAALSREPDVATDLRRIDLGSARELVGTFIGAARTLADATRTSAPATDDWPLQEYTARSLLSAIRYPVPASLFDLGQIGAWCPACFDGGKPVQAVEGLDRYMALLDSAYKRAAPSDEEDAVMSDQFSRQIIQNSTYLESVLIGVHYRLGVGFLAEGRFAEAVVEFREEARLSPNSPRTHRNLGRALAATGATKEAIAELRLAAGLDPGDMRTVTDLGDVLLAAKQYAAAAETLRAVSRLSSASAEVHNKIGIALAADGKFDEAIPEFQRALTLQPDFPDAQRRLSAALEARRRPGAGVPGGSGGPRER